MKPVVCFSTNICTPTVPQPFFNRWTQFWCSHMLGQEEPDLSFTFPYVELNNSLIYMARYEQINHFIKNTNAEWFVNCDCDQSWEANGISKLISLDKDIISAPVVMKSPPHTPNFYFYQNGIFSPGLDYIPTEPFKVDAVGFGFIAIRREAAEILLHNYEMDLFKPPPYNKFNNIMMGEDVAFCNYATGLGLEIWVHPSVKVSHYSYTEKTVQDYNRFLTDNKESILQEVERLGVNQ